LSEKSIDLDAMYHDDRFPRSNTYDGRWVAENQMGPNALWLAEWLCEEMTLEPGMRVLDMGCGKAMSSIFLAEEFGVTVFANDLWISATENWKRIREAGVEESVFPIHAEARSLPYAQEFFDAIVCVDSYFYYGTDDLYLKYFVKFVRPGGQIGIVVPGLMRGFEGPLLKHLVPFWGDDCWGWHTPGWWRRHWERPGLVNVRLADAMTDGWRMYLHWKQALDRTGAGRPSTRDDIEVLEADGGRYIGFIRMIGERRQDK
jgi:SAM-dependent methyltransferase